MEKEIKSNITLVCLNEKFGEELSKLFADTVNMHFANCKEVVEYDLFDSQGVINQCGEEYYRQREAQVVRYTCKYENTLIFANYDLFAHNSDEFKKQTTVIYIKLPQRSLGKVDKINQLAFVDHDENMGKLCDIQIEVKRADVRSAMKEIYRVLGGQ